jgi:hypothetical protein
VSGDRPPGPAPRAVFLLDVRIEKTANSPTRAQACLECEARHHTQLRASLIDRLVREEVVLFGYIKQAYNQVYMPGNRR